MPQMTIWRMRIASRIHKTTDTHSEYVILIAFPLQQWLNESAVTLQYIACFVIPFWVTKTKMFIVPMVGYVVDGMDSGWAWRFNCRILLWAFLLVTKWMFIGLILHLALRFRILLRDSTVPYCQLWIIFLGICHWLSVITCINSFTAIVFVTNSPYRCWQHCFLYGYPTLLCRKQCVWT